MFNSIESYLKALKSALKEADPALAQDALWDAEAHLSSELSALREVNPQISEAEALAQIIPAFGAPEEVAEAYREREILVAAALRPTQQAPQGMPDAPLEPWPSFFGVLKTPKVFTSLLYLVMALPVGIFFFTWAVTGISLSLGLFVLIIGIPFTLAFLGSVRMLALAEGRLVEALLDVRMPRRPSLLPEGKGWMERLKNLLGDRHTWTSLLYLILQLPMGILSFTAVITGLSLSLGFMATPVVALFAGMPSVMLWDGNEARHPILLIALVAVLGFFLLIGVLHMALALGRFQGLLAKHMLVQK